MRFLRRDFRIKPAHNQKERGFIKDLEGVNYALAWEAKAPSSRLCNIT